MDALQDMPADKRRRTLAWALARKDPGLSLFAVTPLQITDVIHLIHRMLKGKSQKQDPVERMIDNLFGDDGNIDYDAYVRGDAPLPSWLTE